MIGSSTWIVTVCRKSVKVRSVGLNDVSMFRVCRNSGLICPRGARVAVAFGLGISKAIAVGNCAPIVDRGGAGFMFAVPIGASCATGVATRRCGSRAVGNGDNCLPVARGMRLR